MIRLEEKIYETMAGHIEICPRSHIVTDTGELILFRCDGHRFLAVCGDWENQFQGRRIAGIKIGLPDHENRMLLNEVLPWTKPIAFGSDCMSFGFGDGVGYANPSQLRSIRGTKIRPVLAQQSVRELRLSRRHLSDVIDTAAWAVLEEGFDKGYACDADHLATWDEIQAAVSTGCTMVTIDYYRIPSAEAVDGPERFLQTAYETIIKPQSDRIDIEVSFNNADRPTDPFFHRDVAEKMHILGVPVTSMAPKFPGEFPPGGEYTGDLERLRKQMEKHAEIAKQFGHKLSLHRASGKLLALRMLDEVTENRFHVKTTGAAWIEALRLISECDPSLYRDIHREALRQFERTAKHYTEVDFGAGQIQPLQEKKNRDLPEYLDQENSRKFLCMSYGPILSNGALKGRIQKFLQDHRLRYAAVIENLYADYILHLLGDNNIQSVI